MTEENNTPTSWNIWIVLWVLPIVLSIINFEADPAYAIGAIIGTGLLVIFMFFKPRWVLPWFGLILIFDLIGYGVLFTESGANIAQLIGNLLKELVFLGYLLFSDNAKRKQGRFQYSAASTNET